MNNVGFRYGTMGLDNMSRLADTENRRNWAQYEQDVLENKAQGEAIGSLVGTGLGLAKGVYQDYQQNKPMDNPPGGKAAVEKVAKESVSPNKVLGDQSVIADKRVKTLGRRVEEYAGNGLGAAAVRAGIDAGARPAILNEQDAGNPWPDFLAGTRYFGGFIQR